MPPGLVEVAAPSIKAVTADEVAVLQWIGSVAHPAGNLLGQRGNVLCVVENLNPGRRFVRGDTFQALEHLVARQLKTALRKEIIGQDGAPDRVRMQHRADARLLPS